MDDIRTDPRFEWWPSAHPDMSDFLGVPIRDGSDVLGIIFAACKRSPGGFTERDERLLGLFASHAAIALTNARLYERGRELSVLEERARLARELHDAVSQKLFSAAAGSVMTSTGVLHVLPPSLETLTHIVFGPKSWYVMYTRPLSALPPGGV